ncbi:hypothetical protein BOX15_Mlig031052g1 [Macrostomum lignano]|uniref:Dihydrolipoamide acetyltransferase component of pyruvate dehydrogenase complex n=2 Tax=Macrostomum lignano TaxID=282301 RepID=A0A267FAS4_9PLAT|nr:hypothetical protein BOX15_Mlig031052g3 [Macrostomum lignano]PAA70247.1 hypothetical protein BOX15_Mlig031052g1 [Macrostomum lignano]
MISFITIRGKASPIFKSLCCRLHKSNQIPIQWHCHLHQKQLLKQIGLTYTGYNKSPQYRYSTSVRMPSLSPTMSEGTIVKWHKAEGDTVQPGDILCDIQTDKAVVSFEFDDEGVLARVLRADGSAGSVGDVIAVMADPGEDWQAVASEAAKLATAADKPPSAAAPPSPSPSTSSTPPLSSTASPPRRIGPAAQLLIRLHRLTPADLRATGPHGTLLKSDVLAQVKSAPPAAVAAAASAPSAGVAAVPATPAAVPAAPAAVPGAPAADSASRPSMRPLEPRTQPGYLDHPVAPGLRDWAALQAAIKSAAPHAYATASCRPRLPASGAPSSIVALAVRALASALSGGGSEADPVNIGALLLAAPALPRLVRLPRAQAMGLREIDRRLAEAASANSDSGPLAAVVCDLSDQPAVQFAHFVLHPEAPLLLTVGTPSASVSSDSPEPPLVRLGLTVDSRRFDHAEAAALLGSVTVGMENPLLGLSGPVSASPAAAAAAPTPPIVGSDLLQLGLDD